MADRWRGLSGRFGTRHRRTACCSDAREDQRRRWGRAKRAARGRSTDASFGQLHGAETRSRSPSRRTRSSVELRAFAGDRVWIGAASEANRAEGFIFDTSSLTAEPGIEVQSPKPVRRIASLGPSADELLVSAETDERRAWPLASFTPSIDGEARVDAVRTVKTAAGLAAGSSAVREKSRRRWSIRRVTFVVHRSNSKVPRRAPR